MTKFASSTGFAIWLTIAPQVLFRRFGLDESQISFVFVAAAILSVAIQAGLFSRLAKHFGDVDLQIAGLAIMAVCPFIMPSTGPFPLFVTFAMVFVIGMSLSLPIPSALASKLASAAMQGRVLGIVDSVNCLGGVCGPVFAGFLLTADHARPIGQYGNSPLLACGVILAIGCAVAVTLRQPKPKSVASPHVAPDKKS